MTTSEVLYVKGMNISESEGDNGADEDIWDDRKLNDAYDKALKMANTEVAKRVAMSTNNRQSNKAGQSKPQPKKHVNQENSFKNTHKIGEWVAGMPCRAIYDGDGLEYEAFVMRLLNEKECLIRFLGYENSEIVPISSLQPSLGKDMRNMQIEEALNDKVDDGIESQSTNVDKMDYVSDQVPSPGSTELSFERKKKTNKKKGPNRQLKHGFELPEMSSLPMPDTSFLRNMGSLEMPIPPPLMFPTGNRVESEDQAVSSMLLSWYMSGYYTGLYQGLRRAKENRRN